jgi:hypothetical protein
VLNFSVAGGTKYTVPAGAPVEPSKQVPGKYWVYPKFFAQDSMARHDATHYGFLVSLEDTEEVRQ